MDAITIAGGAGSNAGVQQRVFLSHTSDLGQPKEPESFVGAAVSAVQRARHAVTDMAYFAARDTSPADYCTAMVTQSDVYVGIVGLRYGASVHDRPALSYTELEFEVASECGLPRLIFLIRETSHFLSQEEQSPEHGARQRAFRARLMDAGLIVDEVGSPTELELGLYQALVELGPAPEAPARLARARALLASLSPDALPLHAPLRTGPRTAWTNPMSELAGLPWRLGCQWCPRWAVCRSRCGDVRSCWVRSASSGAWWCWRDSAGWASRQWLLNWPAACSPSGESGGWPPGMPPACRPA